jgi:glycosyltransferase involved in cell wall biosynthesis
VRLLTVSHFYENHGGGIERVAAQLCRQFVLAGHDTTWAASSADSPPKELIKALSLNCINPSEALTGLPMPIPGPKSIGALARAVRKSDAVIIHDSLYVTSILAMLLAKANRKPVLLIQHIASINFAGAVMRAAIKLANLLVTRPMLNAADQLVFISAVVRQELLGEHSNRLSLLLHNGVDTRIFHPRDPSTRSVVRLEHGLQTDAPLAVFVGRFVEKKGLAVLKELARRRPELQIAMVGTGAIDPKHWGLPNVHVLGQLDQGVIADLYGASDLLLLPSVGEGYPLVIQESMACGLPVICGEESAKADPGASAWLNGVPITLDQIEGSVQRMEAAIDALQMEPAERAAMAEYAAKTYNWKNMASDIIAALNAQP